MDTVTGLAEKSLLLLEEGEPLILGIKYIHIFLWKPSMCRDGPLKTQVKDVLTEYNGEDSYNDKKGKKEKKYSYKGVMLCDMTVEQMLLQ